MHYNTSFSFNNATSDSESPGKTLQNEFQPNMYHRIIDDQWVKRIFCLHVYADLDMSRGYGTLK